MATANIDSRHLDCPVCFCLPRAKVYQCDSGHIICGSCYFKPLIRNCPQCRQQFDKTKPIRCFVLERILDVVDVDCKYAINGCDKILPKGSMGTHENLCLFNIKRFGAFLNICTILGFAQCKLEYNNGNLKDAVDHFESEHRSTITNSGNFKIKLEDLANKLTEKSSNNVLIWKPVIADAKNQQCYIFISAIINKLESTIAWFALFMPYPNHPNFSKPGFQIEFSITNDNNESIAHFVVNPIVLSKAVSLLSLKFSKKFNLESVLIQCDKNKEMVINYHVVKNTGRPVQYQNNIENFICRKESCTSLNKVEVPGVKTKQKSGNRRQHRRRETLQHKLGYFKIYLFGILMLAGALSYTIFINFGRQDTTGTSGPPVTKSNTSRSKLLDIWKKKEFANRITLPEAYHLLHELPKRYIETGYEGSMDFLNMKGFIMVWVAGNGEVDALKYLIANGLNVSEVDRYGWSLLHWAMFDRDKKKGLEKAKVLVEAGNDFQTKNLKNQTVLHFAAWWNGPESCEYFVKLGLDVNAVDIYGNTALHLATEQDYPDNLQVFQMLLELGADKNIKNTDGATPIDYFLNSYLTNALE